MTSRILGSLMLATVLVACGGPPAPATPTSPQAELEAILATAITPAQDSAYRAYSARHGAAVRIHLPTIATDRNADPLARANAVLRMGTIPMLQFDVYRITITDPDPRVRGATLGVIGPLASSWAAEAIPLLAVGLRDPVIGVQAKALQELRDRDLDLLSIYIAGNPPAELREIAIQTMRNAHAWGAPIEPEADGVLRRIAPSGVELIVRPTRMFADFDLTIGALSVVPNGGAERVLADSVEVVAGVIPAVVDPAGRFVAVEAGRRIEVHDLETGTVRRIGAGIAPRPLPFSPDFMYFRERAREELRSGTRLEYELVRAPFESGEPMAFDVIAAEARPSVRGNLSPVRWARIHDRGTRFVVGIDGMNDHVLPSPLDAAPSTE